MRAPPVPHPRAGPSPSIRDAQRTTNDKQRLLECPPPPGKAQKSQAPRCPDWETEPPLGSPPRASPRSARARQGAPFPAAEPRGRPAPGRSPKESPLKEFFLSRELTASIQPRGLKGEQHVNALQMCFLPFLATAGRLRAAAAAPARSRPRFPSRPPTFSSCSYLIMISFFFFFPKPLPIIVIHPARCSSGDGHRLQTPPPPGARPAPRRVRRHSPGTLCKAKVKGRCLG